jgi:hypothetical protein
MTSFAHWIFAAALVPVAVSAAIIATGRLAERARPAVTSPTSSVFFNLFYLAPFSLFRAASQPAVAGVAVALPNTLGGGLVRLPSSGWDLVPAVALYTLAMDSGEYRPLGLFYAVRLQRGGCLRSFPVLRAGLGHGASLARTGRPADAASRH